MKTLSHRRVRKYLNFYKSNFEFKPPYKIVIDETFCLETSTFKLNFQEQVSKYLADEKAAFCTTSCAIREAKKLGQKGTEALSLMKSLGVKKCEHEGEPVSSAECLFSLVKKNNPDKVFVATQNQELINKCRSVASVPLLYVWNNTVCLENPTSARTLQVKRKATEEAPGSKKAHPTKKPSSLQDQKPIGPKGSPQSKKFGPNNSFCNKKFGNKDGRPRKSGPNRDRSFQKKKFGNKAGPKQFGKKTFVKKY